jgi:RNA polymerase sigma-70 factor (sigma-E family)
VDASAAAGFSEFAYSRWPALVRLAYGLTGDRGLAEDLAQTTLASAYASWSRVARAEDPDAYVRRILLNARHGSFRKRRVAEELTGSPPDAAAMADMSGRLSERAAIITALAALPRRQREVIVLRFWLDLTDAQVADLLGCSIGTVKSRASRALAKLRGSAELADWEAR